MSNFVVKDSGNRQQFDTGSQRDTQDGKERFDLIGIQGLKRLAKHMTEGAKKYGERNWELGQPTSRSYASALRHLLQWGMGMRDEDHLSAVCFNCFSIMHVEEGGNNHELRGKYGLMDHPSHSNLAPVKQDDSFYKIVLNVVSYYQVTLNQYGGTTDELYEEYKHGVMNADEMPVSRDEFADGLIWLEKNQYLHLEQDGVHSPVWQVAAVGRPPAWTTEAAKDTSPIIIDSVLLGSDDVCSCGALIEKCGGICSYPDYEAPHAMFCRCEKCEDERSFDD